MKLLNKKGFILVETLIVTLFVLTLFILVYQNLVPSLGEYERMSSYDDVDSVYAINLFKQSLLRYGNMDYITSYLTNHTYLDISNCNDQKIYKNSNYCDKLKKTLSISDNDYIFIKHLKDGGNASIWVAENEGEKYAIKVLGKFSYEKGNRFEK